MAPSGTASCGSDPLSQPGPSEQPPRDLYSAEIVDALSLPGCPVCGSLRAHERRYIGWFWEAARGDGRLQADFAATRGFCPHHAWMLNDHLAARGDFRALGHLYRLLWRRDIAEAEELLNRVGEPPARRLLGRRRLTRPGSCMACAELRRAEARKAPFLVAALADPGVRERYSASEGPCATHLAHLLEHAASEAPEVGAFLIGDWRRRLEELRPLLGDRRRPDEPGHEHQPRGARRRDLTDAVRRYAGRRPAGPSDAEAG